MMDVADIGSPNEGRVEADVEGSMDAAIDGFPGGPHDTSVLSLYADHVVAKVWMGEERPELKLASHGRKVHKFGRPTQEIEGLVAGTGLSPLITCSLETGDRGLISAFVERWHKETSSFHLPIGEMTITLDDVASLFHLPVTGALMTFDVLDVEEAVELLVELLEVTVEEAKAETKQCYGAYVRLSWLRELYALKCQQMEWTVAARAYLLHLVGCTIFANKSATHTGVVFLEAFRDLYQSDEFCWGAAALQHMYDNLNYACQHHGKHIAGYISLLQCWIYAHFPGVASIITDEDYEERLPRTCRWRPGKALPVATYPRRLDMLTNDGVCWTPYTDHRPFRPSKPFAFSQVTSGGGHTLSDTSQRGCYDSSASYRVYRALSATPPSIEEVDARWLGYADHLVVTGDTVSSPGQCHLDYMDWLYTILHPFMSPPQPGEPPRHPPVAPVPADVPAPEDVGDDAVPDDVPDDMPRHAVGVCQRIAQRLQHMVDAGMVTAGTEAYDIIDQCIRLARGVQQDKVVYIRSKRRRT